MNHNDLIQQVKGVACIVSVKRGMADRENPVTIEAANAAYLASVNKQDEEFVPGRPYSYYIQSDPNFESSVKRCVESGEIQHQYVNAGLYNAWLDLYLLPLEPDEERDYCLFTYELNTRAKADKLLDISEGTAMQVLRTCIKLRETPDFQEAMDSIIKDIRRMCESSGCSILLTDFEKKTCRILCADDDGTFSQNKEDDIVFKSQFFSIAETWRDLMAGSNCYIIADEEDMKVAERFDKKWTDSLKGSGVHNVVLYPLKQQNTILGYIWATNFNSEKTVFIKEVMELTTYFISAEVANHMLMERLEFLSRYDMLTGVLSRNAMNIRVDEWAKGKKRSDKDFGVVFVDLNGLKTVNDRHGHMAGDEMIKAVADEIKDVFGAFEIYRAGGDEFMVIAEDCGAGEFAGLVETLKERSERSSETHFAVGSFYDNGPHDIRTAIENADTDMYHEKANYYEAHPEKTKRAK
ncbi:MAG: GGDEF domain-containing protein [Lachnospiraceae bacterium]|nr:GGDEF domain-containing protein [Lachnospiraceae bacterium]